MPTRSKLPRDLSRFAASRHDGEAVAWPGVGKEFAGDSASERPRPPMTGTAEEWAAIRGILGDGAVSQLVGIEPVTPGGHLNFPHPWTSKFLQAGRSHC